MSDMVRGARSMLKSPPEAPPGSKWVAGRQAAPRAGRCHEGVEALAVAEPGS
jgi:hypothetical protein